MLLVDLGFKADPVIKNPAASSSLKDFWKRFNSEYHDWALRNIIAPLSRRIGNIFSGFGAVPVERLYDDIYAFFSGVSNRFSRLYGGEKSPISLDHVYHVVFFITWHRGRIPAHSIAGEKDPRHRGGIDIVADCGIRRSS